MPRQARLSLVDIPHHVVQRGHNRSACFLSTADRAYYLSQLLQHSRECGIEVHAYVLMTNHVHLLVTPREQAALGRFMKAVGQHHAQYINRRYGRTGAVWEGRFWSCPVLAESYLLTCHRYIECNPVRAGLASCPAEYPWSSYRANAEGAVNPLLSPHDVVAGLGRDATERRAAYRALFERPLEPGDVDKIRATTRGGFALGDSPFLDGLSCALGRPVTRPRRGRPPSQPGK